MAVSTARRAAIATIGVALCAGALAEAALPPIVVPLPPGGISVYVSTTGLDVPDGGSKQAPWQHIQYAIDQVASSGLGVPVTVRIAGGVYEEKLIIGTSLTLARQLPLPEGGVVVKHDEPNAPVAIIAGDIRVGLAGLYIDGQGTNSCTTRRIP